MIHISKLWRFEAAHILPRHPGKCARLHGHSFRLELEVYGGVEKQSQFVMDYWELDELVGPIVDLFDHRCLNFFIRYPSSENIAIHIAHLLRPKLLSRRYVVRVSETEKTWAVWDSASDYCRDIFNRCLLDSTPGAMDAEWRSPSSPGLGGICSLVELEALANRYFQGWLKVQTRVEQWHLYSASLTPAVPPLVTTEESVDVSFPMMVKDERE